MKNLQEKYNWEEIQKFYDDGNNWKSVCKEFNLSNYKLSLAVKYQLFKTESSGKRLKLHFQKNKVTLSEETKKKISQSRIKYLKENPDKVPYVLNHSRNESYPEKYFTEVFEQEGLKMTKCFRIGLYELDFSIPDKRIDIEIDGCQHHLDKRIKESDIRRDQYLKELGWDIIRIKWSDYQKLNEDEKKDYVRKLVDYVGNLSNEKPVFEVKESSRDVPDHPCKCGKMIYVGSKQCQTCYQMSQRRVERPSLEVLLKEVEETSYCSVGRKYGVSDNTIRKWIKNYKSSQQI